MEGREIEALKAELRELIVAASDETLREIASFDNHGGGGGVTYPQACQLHFRGLKELIARHDCRPVWSEHSWYPMEAVELRAYVPEAGDPISFGVAIAIILLDDLEDGIRENMEARSSERYLQKYRDLPAEFSVPILSGLDVLRPAWTSAD